MVKQSIATFLVVMFAMEASAGTDVFTKVTSAGNAPSWGDNCSTIQAGDTCQLTTTGTGLKPLVDLGANANCTVCQNTANTTEIQVNQGGDWHTPGGFTLTLEDGCGNLGFNERWQAFRLNVTVGTTGDYHVTCK